jgi:preprotein translocase subunit SecG
MFVFITIIHIIVCVVLIMVVLLQTGKGAEMGAAFGGATQTVFGSSGPAGFLSKLTTAVAVIFMITTLTLCYLIGRLPVPTIMEKKVEQQAEGAAPTAPDQAPAPMQQAAEQAAPMQQEAQPAVPAAEPGSAAVPESQLPQN